MPAPGHGITWKANPNAGTATILAGAHWMAHCACGRNWRGTRSGLTEPLMRHLEAAEYLAFRGTR